MGRTTGAAFFAETLHAYGVAHVFVSPAIASLGLAELSARGVTSIVTHGEKAAAYMADGYARACNRPALCLAQSVGAANLAAGLQDAYLALSPVIALTGRKTPAEQFRNAYQEIEHAGLFAPVTKFSGLVETVEQFPHLLRLAFREATTGATAPVHLDLQGISGNVIMEGEADLEVLVESPFTRRPAFRPEADPNTVRQAARALAGAERPVIVAGGGVTSSQAQHEVLELAEKLSIPVATSLNAKGTIPDQHRLAVGVVGTYSRWCANRVVHEADLVLFIGSHTGSQVTNEWKIPSVDTPVIQIDLDPSELGRNYSIQVSLHGDAKATTRRLIEAVEGGSGRADWLSRVRGLVREWRAEVAPRARSEAVPIIPERLCTELTEFLARDAVLVSDTGHAGIWTASMVDLNHPRQSYLRCAGSLGWALPAAVGAQLALPDRQVVCFTGDGGFWYHLGEIETAVRWNVPVIIVINNNRGLIQDKAGDDKAFARVPGTDSSPLWKFNDVDLAAVAAAMGAFAVRVERPAEIRGALEQAAAAGRPAVVEVVTDPADSSSPPRWNPPAD